MDDIERVEPSWQFQWPVARLCRGVLSGRVDVSQPSVGLQDISIEGRHLDARLLCVASDKVPGDRQEGSNETPWPIADAYVRGNDLVATYKPRDDWPFSPQVYWHAGAAQPMDNVLGTLDVMVSVQTHLLETWPRIDVQSHIGADEVLYITPDTTARDQATPLHPGEHRFDGPTSPTCVLHRLPGRKISYAEIMPASDFREVSVRWDAGVSSRTQWELFADFLEKGVIWRARLQSVLLPRTNDVELAIACCRKLAERPLPLTT